MCLFVVVVAISMFLSKTKREIKTVFHVCPGRGLFIEVAVGIFPTLRFDDIPSPSYKPPFSSRISSQTIKPNSRFYVSNYPLVINLRKKSTYQ